MINSGFKSEYYEVIAGALLHDIGIFMQRAEPSGYAFSENTKRMENNLCKQGNNDGKKTKYQAFTWQFFEENHLIFPSGLNAANIQKLASFHHQPENNVLLQIIQKADHLSSGLDSSSIKEGDETNPIRCMETPLQSIFSEISINSKSDKKYYGLNSNMFSDFAGIEDFEKSLFPHPHDNCRITSNQYKTLWHKFITDLRKIKTDDCKIFIGTLMSVLKKYTWCIPSSTDKTQPDIPLYDHLATTAAIASALYEYHKESGEENFLTESNKKLFTILSGDLSGIQRFIFQMKQEGAKNVSKILRGRSFYLVQMTSAAVHLLLDSLGLSTASRIIDAGGKFSLLIANTQKNIDSVKKCKALIDKFCLENFAASLSLIIDDSVKLSMDDLRLENYANAIESSGSKAESAKKQPLLQALKDNGFLMSDMYEGLKENNDCSFCGREPASGKHDSVMDEQEKERKKRGKICNKAYDIGKDLPNTKFIELERTNENSPSDFFGRYRLKLITKDKFKTGENTSYVESINEFGQEAFPVAEMSNYVPRYKESVIDGTEMHLENEIKTFESIAEESEGIKLLGILKADLDNMGFIFRKGFTNISLSRFVCLSRSINYFFTVYLTGFLRKEFPDVYTLFAGGDDLCLIGPWDKMINLAQKIHGKFFEYIGKNPDITISAGLNFVKPGYPAGKAISKAEHILEHAKSEGKDRIAFFGHTAKWGDELNRYMDFSEALQNEFNKGENSIIRQSTLYRFLQYYKEYRALNAENLSGIDKLKGALWISHLRYDIGRNMLDHRNVRNNQKMKDEVLELLKPMLESHSSNEKPFMEKLPLALFPMIYKNR